MGLIPLYGRQHGVAGKCLGFVRQSQRADGSWPIDTNLSVWLTTATVAALAAAANCRGSTAAVPPPGLPRSSVGCVIRIPGRHRGLGMDTSCRRGRRWGRHVGSNPRTGRAGSREGIPAGVRWLLDLQNRDGGWPTFCRGWGKLPFDKSSPDLTAHALRALCLRGFDDAPATPAPGHPARAALSSASGAAGRRMASALVWKPAIPGSCKSCTGDRARAPCPGTAGSPGT